MTALDVQGSFGFFNSAKLMLQVFFFFLHMNEFYMNSPLKG